MFLIGILKLFKCMYLNTVILIVYQTKMMIIKIIYKLYFPRV